VQFRELSRPDLRRTTGTRWFGESVPVHAAMGQAQLAVGKGSVTTEHSHSSRSLSGAPSPCAGSVGNGGAAFSVSVDSTPSGQGFSRHRGLSSDVLCRCKYTAREEYAPALLKHRLDEKLKIYGFPRKATLVLSILLGVVTSAPYGVHRKP
jgi:hypothetical protein